MRVVAAFCVFTFSIGSAVADPRDFDRIIVIGDSLSDNGNRTNIPVGGAPLTPAPGGVDVGPPAPYFFGRFSDGPTWAELLSGPAGPNGESSQQRFWDSVANGVPLTGGSVNVAIGGALAADASNPQGDIDGFIGITRGVPEQIAAYQAYSAASGQTPFQSGDLVTLMVGANDLFIGLPEAAATGKLAELGAGTAQNVSNNLQQIISGGGRTILVSNVPDIGITPLLVDGGEAAVQAGNAATDAFNQSLDQNVRAIAGANPDVNIVQMDLRALFNIMLANPAAFGFDPALATKPCNIGFFGTIPAVNGCDPANPEGFFWWDQIHPSGAVHELMARYAELLLSTEQTGKAVGALGQVALSTRLEASDILFRRGVSPLGESRQGIYAEVIGQTASFDGERLSTGDSTAFDYSLGGVRAGFDGKEGPLEFGASIAYQTGSISAAAFSSDVNTTQIDAYALRHFSPFFVGLEGGFSINDYNDLNRATGFPTVSADGSTQSFDYTVAATLGMKHQIGDITLTPALRVGYASMNIDGFTENAPILALQYGRHDITTGFWSARLRAATPFFSRATAYGEVGYEGLFATDGNYDAGLAFNTAQAVTIDDDLEARGFFLKAGLEGMIGNGMKISGEYELSLQDGAGDIHSGRLRLTIPLGE